MNLTRRRFGQTIALSMSVPATAVAATTGTWELKNSLIHQKLALQDRSLVSRALINVRTGKEWIHPAIPSEEFFVSFSSEGGPPAVFTGKGPLRLHKETTASTGDWTELRLKFELGDTPLRITRRYLCHRVLPVIRQETTLHNTGGVPLRIHACDAFRLRVAPTTAPLELHWINNFGRAMHPEPGNPIHHASVDDNSQHAVSTGPYSPDIAWFALAAPELRGGLVGGWEWSGPMTITFGDRRDPCLIHGGLDPLAFAEPLAPGSEFAGPMGWYGFYEGGLDEAAYLSHQLVETLAPPLTMASAPWVGYCTWAASMDEKSPHNEGSHPWFPTERNILSQVDAAAELGCDLFLWDYGWFPRVGDWHCDPQRYPQGPAPVVRAVKRAGMKMGLWVGFGNADDLSEVVRQHPDWLATYGGKPIPDGFFTRTAASTWKVRTLCLAHRPAREWVKQQLARIIDSFELDWLKHDFDLITICQDRNHTHPPGDSRVASVEGFYEIMDYVRSGWPNLLCENWMNNSAVPDYGVLQRHHVQLIGDAYQPFQLRRMFYGHAQVFPPHRQHRYIRFEDGTGDFRNMVRSGSVGGPWTLLSDPRRLSAEQHGILKAEIAAYRAHRHLLVNARVSRLLGRPHPRAWDAVQFWRPDLREGLVYVFRGHDAEEGRTILLHHIPPDARARVTSLGVDVKHSQSGARLSVTLPQGTSALFHIRV
ncbi:MAG: alpha-galactosidase [Bryobacteraceae bacterium]|nr:alpha-galactosidase [Bryobacterales bacterium]MEB2363248.1 alpha-galactosidase [Bryobacterales bacterium]NUN02895.1 alpha-galactosidase [Bryobacteraceae bacterium]